MNTAIDDHHIAQWLLDNPDFFVRQAKLLADLRLTSPYSHRAISLQERQLEVLREKNKNLELRLAELVRYGHANDSTLENLHQWLLTVLAQPTIAPEMIEQALREIFFLPCSALLLWPTAEEAQTFPAILKKFADNATTPRCGIVDDDLKRQAQSWLGDENIASLALVPLKPLTMIEASNHSEVTLPRYISTNEDTSVGLLLLGAHDSQRFSAEKGVAYLKQIGELISAVVSPTRLSEI